jgi:hypothetical protein
VNTQEIFFDYEMMSKTTELYAVTLSGFSVGGRRVLLGRETPGVVVSGKTANLHAVTLKGLLVGGRRELLGRCSWVAV